MLVTFCYGIPGGCCQAIVIFQVIGKVTAVVSQVVTMLFFVCEDLLVSIV